MSGPGHRDTAAGREPRCQCAAPDHECVTAWRPAAESAPALRLPAALQAFLCRRAGLALPRAVSESDGVLRHWHLSSGPGPGLHRLVRVLLSRPRRDTRGLAPRASSFWDNVCITPRLGHNLAQSFIGDTGEYKIQVYAYKIQGNCKKAEWPQWHQLQSRTNVRTVMEMRLDFYTRVFSPGRTLHQTGPEC